MTMLKRIIFKIEHARALGGYDDGDVARAVFAEMSRPTEAMIKAGTERISQGESDGDSVWQAMIDAELYEGERPRKPDETSVYDLDITQETLDACIGAGISTVGKLRALQRLISQVGLP